MTTTERWERLGEIQLEMLDLLQESEKIVSSASQPAKERATVWMKNIQYALSNVNNPIRGQTVTMDDTIYELEPCEDA